MFLYALPLGFIATELGWIVREIGRQPFIVYNMIRTSQGLSPNLSGVTALSLLIAFGTVYITLLFLFIYFTAKIVRKGPNLSEMAPLHHRKVLEDKE
jgi:cytochrome d ubiquinol oxidase subunit I